MFRITRRYQPLILGALGFFLTACPGDNGPDGAPVIGSFSASPATLTAGQSATLTWSVSGSPTSLEISGVGPVSGTSRSVTPTATTQYTLTATNSSGQSDTETTTVTVTGGVTPPPSGTVPDFGVSALQTGPFQNDAGGNIVSAGDARVVNVAAGSTFYARVSYSDPDGIASIAVRLANSSPAGFAADLTLDQNVSGFTLGAPLPGCDLTSNPTSATCIYPITVAAGTPNISSLTPSEFAYVLRTRVTDAAGTLIDEPPRGYVTVGSVGGGTTTGGTTGGSTGTTTGGTTGGGTTGSTTGSTTGTTTGGTTGSTTGTTTGGSTTGGSTGGTTGSTTGGTTGTTTGGSTGGSTTGGGSAFSVSVAEVAPVTLGSSVTATASLNGTVSNAPSTGTTSTQWTAEGNNSGNVTFTNPSSVDTTATFRAAGSYTLELTANNIVGDPDDDNITTRSDTVQVVVRTAGGSDTVRPTVTITPPSGTVTTPTVSFSVTFNENVFGFNGGDIQVGGTAGAKAATVTGSGSAYTVNVTGMTQDGTVTARVSANGARDAANNLNIGSSTATAQYNAP